MYSITTEKHWGGCQKKQGPATFLEAQLEPLEKENLQLSLWKQQGLLEASDLCSASWKRMDQIYIRSDICKLEAHPTKSLCWYRMLQNTIWRATDWQTHRSWWGCEPMTFLQWGGTTNHWANLFEGWTTDRWGQLYPSLDSYYVSGCYLLLCNKPD